MPRNNVPKRQKDALPPQLREILPMSRLTNIPPKQNAEEDADE